MQQKLFLFFLFPLLWIACTDQENPVVDPNPPIQVVVPAWVKDYRLLFTPDGKQAKITPEQIEKEVMGKKWMEVEFYVQNLPNHPGGEHSLHKMGWSKSFYERFNRPVYYFAPDSVTEIDASGARFVFPMERNKDFSIFSSPLENRPETPTSLLEFVESRPRDRVHWVLLSLENNELVFMHNGARFRPGTFIQFKFSRCVLLPD